MRAPLTPWAAYAIARNQLGSIRKVYLRGNSITARRDFAEHEEIVLLLHGFFQTRSIWEVMEDRLRYDDYGVMSFNQGGLGGWFNTWPIDTLARMVAEKIEALRERYGFEALHILGHSKGGLVARKYVQHYGGDKRVKSVTTLGTPHHGTPTAALALLSLGLISSNPRELMPGSRIVQALNRDTFPAHIPLTSVFSKEDVVCPYWSSMLRPRRGESSMENVQVREVGHSQLTWDPGVYHIVRERLERAARLWRERHGGLEASGPDERGLTEADSPTPRPGSSAGS